MKYFTLLLVAIIGTKLQCHAQGYEPKIESCPCMIKVDNKLISQCGYLVVPEDRKRPKGNHIKVPFVFVRRPDQDAVKNITLYTTGGPGYSTINGFDSISYNSGYLQYGGFIAFDQRGTKNAQPCLDCQEVDAAIIRSYKEQLSKDSLVLLAVKQCQKKFSARGINLSAYNTIESAADINDLHLALHLDSLNLLGISYSGGLMLTVVRNHPECVRTLLLNSSLPGFVRYEEDALLNIDFALNQVFTNAETDSLHDMRYQNLRARFHQYFTGITGKDFTVSYAEKGTHDTMQIHYSKDELLDAIVERISTNSLQEVPLVINDIIRGNHKTYITEVLDDRFGGNKSLSVGMRYSVYCTEQIAYANKALIKKQEQVLPWLSGYSFNNVNHAICDCWKTRPEPVIVKNPVYSAVPALLSSGDADPWCPLYYNRILKHYLPNAQLLVFHNRAHGSGFGVDGINFVKMFLGNPYQKITTTSKKVTVE